MKLRVILPVSALALVLTTWSCSSSPEPSPSSQPASPPPQPAAAAPDGKTAEQFGGGACQVAELAGFNKSEPWGAWGAQDPARVVFKEPVKGHVKLRFNAYTMNDHESHRLQVRLDSLVRIIELTATPKVFELDYPLEGEAKELVLSGITPRSAQSVGLAADGRLTTVGLLGIECTAVGGPK